MYRQLIISRQYLVGTISKYSATRPPEAIQLTSKTIIRKLRTGYGTLRQFVFIAAVYIEL